MFAFSAFPADAAAWLALLLHVSAKGTLVLVTAAVVCLALRRASAALRHLIWTLAIVCVLCLPLLSMVLPSWQVRGLPRAVAASPVPDAMAERVGRPTTTEVAVAASSADVIGAETDPSARASSLRSPQPSPSPSVPTAGPSLSQRIPSLVLSLWALGALAACAHVLISMLCVHRGLRRARRLTDPSWQRLVDDASAQLRLRRPVTLLSSRFETVPMVWGWRRAILLLPAEAEGWSPQRRWLVILHELAHVKRADCLTQMLGYLARALYWFNPLAWLATRQLRREREQACDDLVLNSGLKSSDYAAHLLAIAGRLQRPALAHMAAVAMAHRAGLEDRIRAILDARRTRRAVPRLWALVVALAAAGLLVAVASVQGADAQAADQTTPHGLGAREQWQPQTESDPRLQQPVHFEILGRAAVPVLAMLSEATGLSLGVAPEDLETVGERKLTIIAQGCTLKSLMAQIPKALQECHWDIDPSGAEPVYLLHRNAGADLTMAQLVDKDGTRWQEERRPAREARVEAARKALAMSPEELAELEKTDPLLCAAVRDPETRKRLELLLTLPAKDMQEFIATGRAYLEYSTAPEPLRQAAEESAAAWLEKATARGDAREIGWAKLLRDSLPEAGICFEDYRDGGISLVLQCYDKKGEFMRRGDFLRAGGGGALPPRLPSDHTAKYSYRPLLLRTGCDEKTADTVLAELVKQHDEQAEEERERKHELEWREPQSPALHRTITLPFAAEEPMDPIEMQRFIAKETGLSLISDYFTRRRNKLPEEALATMPVWQLLYMLGDHSFMGRYDWNEAGDCLVFHDRSWHRLALLEFPESLAQVCRDKLKKQGSFTLEDVAAVAVALAERGIPPASLRGWHVNVPGDLSEAGLSGYALASEALLLYAYLSPEQRAKARSAAGLPYTEMSVAQQELVRPYAFYTGGWNRDKHPIPEEEIAKGVYRIQQSSREVGSETRQMFDLRVEFPSLEERTVLNLLPPKAAPEPALAGQD